MTLLGAGGSVRRPPAGLQCYPVRRRRADRVRPCGTDCVAHSTNCAAPRCVARGSAALAGGRSARAARQDVGLAGSATTASSVSRPTRSSTSVTSTSARHHDRPPRHVVGRNGTGPAMPHRSGGSIGDRCLIGKAAASSGIWRSTSATTCGLGTTCTSPIRTTATTTSPARSRSRRCRSSPSSSATDRGSDSERWCCRSADRTSCHGRGQLGGGRRTARLQRRRRCAGQGHPPLRRGRGLGAGRAVAHVPAPSSPGGMQCGMALPVVKSMTVLVTGLPLTNDSRYCTLSKARSRAV